jgi:hypothetical protein
MPSAFTFDGWARPPPLDPSLGYLGARRSADACEGRLRILIILRRSGDLLPESLGLVVLIGDLRCCPAQASRILDHGVTAR